MSLPSPAPWSSSFTRRTALVGFFTAAAGVTLAACGTGASNSTAAGGASSAVAAAPTTAPATSSAAVTASTTAATTASAAVATASTTAATTASAVTSAPSATAASTSVAAGTGANRLEIFSWWTSGGEVQALQALYNVYKAQHPGVTIVNSALAGGAGAGGNMKAVLATRMLGNDPPDSFQVHLGAELSDGWVKAGKMAPLDSLYAQQGYAKVMPKDLLAIASTNGHPYSVPVNVHRNTIIWYNKKVLGSVGGTPPATWNDFMTLAEKLKAKGIPAIGLAEATPGSVSHLLEALLIAKLGPVDYQGLFSGKVPWSDKRVTDALTVAQQAMGYANPDYLSVQGANQPNLISDGKVAMIIDGDWTNGLLKQLKFTDYGWAPAPETDGVYDLVSDSFGLPNGVKDQQAAMWWLEVCGSKAGQDAFNPPKGSISPRSDRDVSNYDDYQKWAVTQYQGAQHIVPSLEDGSAASPSFVTDYDNTTNYFAAKKDVAQTQAKLEQAAQKAKFGSGS